MIKKIIKNPIYSLPHKFMNTTIQPRFLRVLVLNIQVTYFYLAVEIIVATLKDI